MNILFTSDLSGLGGGETALLNICAELKKQNQLFAVCACEGKLVSLLKSRGITTYVINYRNKKKLFSNLIKIRKILQTNKIQITHSNDPLTSVIFYAAGLGLNIRNFWTCHGQWYKFNFVKKFLIRNANEKVFCVCTKVQQSLQQMGFRNTEVSYLGIPMDVYAESSPYDLKAQLNIADSCKLIAVVGRYQKIKGQLKLVQAVELLLQKNLKIVCLMVGGCVFHNAEEQQYFEEIKHYVKQHHLEPNIIFLGERNDVPSILKSIDALVIPSDNESFGMVAVEAMASGTPVLSTPNDGVSEIFEYNQDMLAKSCSAQDLAELVYSYFSDESQRQRVAAYIEKRKTYFDIQKITSVYAKTFYGRN